MSEPSPHTEHDDADCFAWQREWGEFGAWPSFPLFVSFVRPTDRVIDFGAAAATS